MTAVRVLVVGPRHATANSRGGMAELVALMREHRDPRVRIRTVATYVDDPRVTRLAVGVLGTLWAALLLLARRADVVHVHLAHRGSVVRKAVVLHVARLAGVPAVVHAHSYDFAGWFDGLGPRAARAVRAMLPAQRWYVLGDALGAEYRERLQLRPDVVEVLRNPVRPRQRGERDDGVVRVLSLGRLGGRKGSYDLVDALARLDADTRARLRVTLAGDGEVDEVRAAAASAGVADVVTVRSWVGPDERDALLAGSDVFVLASHEEGLPLALLEAMATGLAAVTTPVGAIGEIVTDGLDAVLVPPADPPALAAALTGLVTDPARRAELGAAARLRTAGLGVDAWFETLITEWQRLAGFSAARR